MRQRDPKTLIVTWTGFPQRAEPEILRRAGRWVSAEWSPEAAVAALKAVSEGKQRNRELQRAASEALRKITGTAPEKKKKKD